MNNEPWLCSGSAGFPAGREFLGNEYRSKVYYDADLEIGAPAPPMGAPAFQPALKTR